MCVVVGRRVIAPARVTSGCGARRRHGRASCWRAAPDAFRANSTSSERRLTRVVSPRPVYGDALASFRNTGAPQCCVASVRVEAGVRTGGCLCGAVSYSVRGDPVHVRRCHCADCRKESGSAFSVYAQWPVEAFEMSGEISSYDGRSFCPRCGSRLLDAAAPGDTLIEIRIGRASCRERV